MTHIALLFGVLLMVQAIRKHSWPMGFFALAMVLDAHFGTALSGFALAVTVPTVYYNRPVDSTAGTTINVDFSKDLTLQHESEVPLLTLLSKLKTQKTETNEFKFAIGRFAPRTSTTTAGTVAAAVGATATVSVTAGSYFTPGDTIEAPSDYDDATHTSQLYVVSVSSNDLTCRAYDPATYGVCTIDSGAVIRRIAPGMIEGSSGTNSSQTVPTVYTQYCQSYEHYFDVTFIQDANRNYTGPERTRLREETRKKHAVDIEYSLFLQKKVKDTTTTGKPRYQQDGLIAQITSNVTNYGASLSDTELYDFMTDVHSPMYSGGNKRMVLASSDLLSDVNKMATNAIRITTRDTTWGPNITEVQFAGKVWQFVESPTLSEARPGWGVVIHPSYMKLRTLIPMWYEMNVQNPKDKFYQDGFYTVQAIEVRLEEVFGILKP
jgi:hypothetical protein